MKHKKYLLPLLGITLLWSNSTLPSDIEERRRKVKDIHKLSRIFYTKEKIEVTKRLQLKMETEWAKKQPIGKVNKKLSSIYRSFTNIYNHILRAEKPSEEYKKNLTNYTAKILQRRLSLKRSLKKIHDKKKTKNIKQWVKLIKYVIKTADDFHALLTGDDPDFETRTVSLKKAKEYKKWSDNLRYETGKEDQTVITKKLENPAVFDGSTDILQKIFHLMSTKNGMSDGIKFTVGSQSFKDNRLKKLGRMRGWTPFDLKDD